MRQELGLAQYHYNNFFCCHFLQSTTEICTGGRKFLFKPTPKNSIRAIASVVPFASIKVIPFLRLGIEFAVLIH